MSQPTSHEIENLHARVSRLVTDTLKSDQNPHVSVRSQVHCQVMPTHYRCPLSGAQQLDITHDMSKAIKRVFPGYLLRCHVSDPGSTQMTFTLYIPIEHAYGEKASKRSHRGPIVPAAGVPPYNGFQQQQGSGFERPLLLLLFLVILGLGAYVVLLK